MADVTQKIDSTILARYVLHKVGQISQLKLQKLLYYIQAWHLAYFGEPLIEDEFQAWMHGPVVRRVWEEYKGQSVLFNDIVIDDNSQKEAVAVTKASLSEDQLELIADVLSEYGSKSAYELEKLTHSESPWVDARRGTGPAEASDTIITKTSITEYFKKLLIPS